MLNGEDMARLCIYGANPEDSGMYTINVSNAFGQTSDVINVNIVGKFFTSLFLFQFRSKLTY